jgi:hypothetical protein
VGKDHALPVRLVDRCIALLLQLANRNRGGGALGDQLYDLLIQFINLVRQSAISTIALPPPPHPQTPPTAAHAAASRCRSRQRNRQLGELLDALHQPCASLASSVCVPVMPTREMA